MQCTNRCPLYPRKRTNLPPHLVDDPSSTLGVNLTKPHVFGLGPFQVTYQIIVGSIRANHSGEFAKRNDRIRLLDIPLSDPNRDSELL